MIGSAFRLKVRADAVIASPVKSFRKKFEAIRNYCLPVAKQSCGIDNLFSSNDLVDVTLAEIVEKFIYNCLDFSNRPQMYEYFMGSQLLIVTINGAHSGFMVLYLSRQGDDQVYDPFFPLSRVSGDFPYATQRVLSWGHESAGSQISVVPELCGSRQRTENLPMLLCVSGDLGECARQSNNCYTLCGNPFRHVCVLMSSGLFSYCPKSYAGGCEGEHRADKGLPIMEELDNPAIICCLGKLGVSSEKQHSHKCRQSAKKCGNDCRKGDESQPMLGLAVGIAKVHVERSPIVERCDFAAFRADKQLSVCEVAA